MIVFFVIASDCEAKPKQERSNLLRLPRRPSLCSGLLAMTLHIDYEI